MKISERTQRRFEQLMSLFDGESRLLIVMQDHPDPDSIAAAVALRRLVNALTEVKCSIAHGGTVGRGENRALVKYLNLNLHPIDGMEFERYDLIAMVDAQPGAGNHSLPAGVLPDIVIDHHPCRQLTREVPYSDVRREYGSTCTILVEYLVHANVSLETSLVTAMLYGIRSDTQDLGREAMQADIEAFEYLYPMANKRMLSAIQRGSVPRAYFQMLSEALRCARIYDKALVTCLGAADNPDMVAEVADLFLREDQTAWTLCMGVFEEKMLLSLRTSEDGGRADQVMKRIVARRGTGGGHQTYAGGQIPLKNGSKTEITKLQTVVRQKYLQALELEECRFERLVHQGTATAKPAAKSNGKPTVKPESKPTSKLNGKTVAKPDNR
ncbi:bifunctional oligoribonuclease/PAP phosphatase NrnA [Planctomycetota bacterium]